MDNQQLDLGLDESSSRKCRKCKQVKPLDEFYTYVEKRRLAVPATYRMHTCKKCFSRYKMDQYNRYKTERPWHERKRLVYLKGMNDYYRDAVMDHYGRRCVCCGETEHVFLTIDHIKPLGHVTRRAKLGHTNIYRFLVKNKFPEGFRVLCYNCNCGRTRTADGECPHIHQSSSQARAQARSSKGSETPETLFAEQGRDMVGTAMKVAAVFTESPWGLQ